MKRFGLIGLVMALTVWQVTVRAGSAVLLKACSYQVMRNGYPMPKRVLPIGAVVKVLATHGAKADVVTASGDPVSVRLACLRLLPKPSPSPPGTLQAPAAAPAAAAAATPAPASTVTATATSPLAPTPPPSPSPGQTGGGREQAGGTGPVRPDEPIRRPVPVRCSHVLKNGQQCSRMTTSPNGLCWQHGGD